MHEPYKNDDISSKITFGIKNLAKQSRIIPGSKCMNRLSTTRSDIRIHPRGLAY